MYPLFLHTHKPGTSPGTNIWTQENFQGVKSNNYRDDDEFLKCVEQLLKTQIGKL